MSLKYVIALKRDYGVMSYYVTRKFLEAIFGKDPLKFSLPIVGVGKSKSRVSYTVKVVGLSPRQISQTFWRLRHIKLVDFRENEDGSVRAILTEAGKKKILNYNLDTLAIKKPKHWDGVWHIVIFDIPEKKKPARNALTEEMKRLGLVPFQKSVWIYPYFCKDEIDFVAQVFEVGKYVHYITTRTITNDGLLRQKFKLESGRV